jgi:hypothetical protein
MQVFKGAIIAATIIATVATLGACRKEIDESPMKLGASDVAVVQVR